MKGLEENLLFYIILFLENEFKTTLFLLQKVFWKNVMRAPVLLALEGWIMYKKGENNLTI